MPLAQQLEAFLIAAILGGLIGLERQFSQTDEHGSVLGIRTFIFISLLGAISALISDDHLKWFPVAAFLGLVGLILVRYSVESRSGDFGITTEVTALLTFLLGALTYWQQLRVAIALAVAITLILDIKPELQRAAKRIELEDIRAIIKFAVLSFIILPVLKDETIDPWGLFNPREVWFMVVLISAIGFGGYIMLKFARIKGALELTGLFGGIVSSTAVTLNFSRRSKEMPLLSRHLSMGILLAEMVMFPRLLLLVSLAGPKLLRSLMIPLGAMGVICLAFIMWHWMQYRERGKGEEEVVFRNPFEIGTALKFGAIYAAIRVAAALALKYYGQKGLFAAAILSGIAETDAITLTIARMAQNAGTLGITPHVGAYAVTFAVVMNTLFKGSLAVSLANAETFRPIALSFAVIIVAGLACLLFI